jgi:hypothetical protein
MTEHPLTDEMVSDLIQPICEWAYSASMSDYDRILHGTEFDMEADRAQITEEIEIATKIVRDAYDLGRDAQLEQVIEWLKVNLWVYLVLYCSAPMNHDFYKGYTYLYDNFPNVYIKEDELLEDLREAMRPTNTQEEES